MLMLKIKAVADLMRRYLSVFGAAWAIRHKIEDQAKLSHELAFLPANLELVETPLHPAPRWSMRCIVGLALIILVIVLVGQLDIVVSAKGKLLPDARVKLIQPALTGVVREILVKDGQRVEAGQLLMELDTRQADADADNALASRINSQLAIARSQALLNAQQKRQAPVVVLVDGAQTDDQQQAQHYAEGQYHEYLDKLASAEAELAKRTAELDNTNKEISKLEATAPLARQQAESYRALAKDRYVAQTDYLDKEQAALSQEHEMAALRSHAQQLLAAMVQQRAEIASITSQFRRAQFETLDKATQQLAQDSNNVAKTQTRQQLLSLKAPVSGTVQQLTVHTLGGVVTTAQQIMEIVPDDAILVEVNVENKDIGFVEAGQEAIVKVEAFPYTQYGYLNGKVVSVSNDAMQDKKLGLTFTARLKLDTDYIQINNKRVHLTPGMEVTAEIKTGQRSVAHYFLDPLMQTSQESLRER